MNEIKLCKDCKYYEPSEYSGEAGNYDKCVRDCNNDVVIGEYRLVGLKYFCEIERSYGNLAAFLFRKCGRSAKYWEKSDYEN